MESSEISDDTLEESTIDRVEMDVAKRPRRQAAIRAGDLRSHLIGQNLI